MSNIDTRSGIPLYIQIKEIIKNDILSGKFKAWEKIPTEKELCKLYNVSRITIQKALNVLMQEKMLVRKQGKGTFVTPFKLRRRLPKLYSFSEDMKELGLIPSSRVLEKKITKADEEMMTFLRLGPEERKITKIVRIRLANDEPVLIERTCIPYKLAPELINEDLEHGSLYTILSEKYGLILDHAEEVYEVTLAKGSEAKLLECEDPSPAFFITRVTYLKNGEPIELTRSIGRGDKLRFTLQLVKDEAQFRRSVEI